MFKKLFQKRTKKLKENEVRVLLPEENYSLLHYQHNDLPCVAVVNAALKAFEPKEIFSWHLSVIIDFQDLIAKGMPSQEERELVDPFCDELDEQIKSNGNALFFIRETWNKTRRMVWRVYNPEIAHQYLQHIVDQENHPRPFDWHMEQDMNWEQATWYFKQLN